MDVKLSWVDASGGRAGEKMIELADDAIDESIFWEALAATLPELPMPMKGEPDLSIAIDCPLGDCGLVVKGRDSHFVNGREIPSPAIFPERGSEDGIPALPESNYDERYLTFCSAESAGGHGSYKFYRLFQNPDGAVGAEYGRIGQGSGFGAARQVKDPYPSWMFHIKLAEKLMKGYRDETAAYLGERRFGEARRESALEPLNASQRLFKLLSDAARNLARRELRFADGVTAEQARESRRILYEMGRRKTVKGFNSQLMRLLQVAPRNLARVSDALASSEGDFARIIAREEDLVRAMEGVAGTNRARKSSNDGAPSFDDLGIAVRLANGRERETVMRLLSTRLSAKVVEVYSVEHAGQAARFAEWVDSRGGIGTKLLWHGSPACNWASIMGNSLRMPSAVGVAHGSMFGRGIYFAALGNGAGSAKDGGGEKSWGYTGARDSRWHRGQGGDVYMALFEVAYGKPLEVTSAHAYSQLDVDAAGCDCVRARRAAGGLQNDEIVVYDERACRIRYLVRFAA